jgi:nicotinamidase-related amidase
MTSTALVVIDIQRGAFDGARCPPVDRAEELVRRAAALIESARSGGTPVVFIQHCEGPGEPFEQDSPHGELHEELSPLPGDTIVRKRASSAFQDTELASVLEGLGVTTLVVCGLQSEFCVSNTSKDALERGYEVRVARDAHSTWPSNGEAAAAISEMVNEDLARLGALLEPTESLARALRARLGR